MSGGQEVQIRTALFDLIRCPDSDVELCLSAVRATADSPDLSDLAISSLSVLRECHNSPLDTSKCVLLHLELLLRADRVEDSVQLLSANQDAGFEPDVGKRVVMTLWECATRLVETGRHHQALTLYTLCLNRYLLINHILTPLRHIISRYDATGLGDNNLAKLHRNLSTCLLELGRLEEAMSSLQSAVNLSPNSPYTHYIGYKLALLLDNSSLVSCISVCILLRSFHPVLSLGRRALSGYYVFVLSWWRRSERRG